MDLELKFPILRLTGFSHCDKILGSGARDLSQLVESMSNTYEALGSIPGPHTVLMMMCTCNLSTWEVEAG